MCIKSCVFLIIFVIVGAFNFLISWEGPSIDKNIKCSYGNYSAICNREVNFWKLKGNVSTSIIYLPKDHGLSLSLMWDHTTVLYNETISQRNLIPFGYIEIPKILGSVSFRFYNLSITDRFHCCLEARENFLILFNHHHIIGCIDFSLEFLSDDPTLLNKIPYEPKDFDSERRKFLLLNFLTTFSLSMIIFFIFSALLHCYEKKYSQKEDDEVSLANEIQ